MNNQLSYYPDYSSGNPYQKLLYEPLQRAGWALHSEDAAKTAARAALNTHENMIFHVHWLNAVLASSKSDLDAWIAVNKFMQHCLSLKLSGVKLIWTIHNHLPHENRFGEQDLRLRHFLCHEADRIHLHCATHLSELSYLPIEIEKVAIHRHGSYIGYYGKFELSQRFERIDSGNRSALFVGMLREYKGIDDLLGYAINLRRAGIEVTIAGQPETDAIRSKFESISAELGVNIILRRLSEAEIHSLCTNHDVGLLSYDRILTSGTLKLYQSYGMAIISPRMRTIESEDRFRTFRYTTDQRGKKVQIAKLLKSAENRQLREECSMNFFSAQECRWAESLFTFGQPEAIRSPLLKA